MKTPIWFDSHLDLACLAVNGRRMDLPLAELDHDAAAVFQPAAVTLPSLKAGGVRFALATIFTEADGDDAVGYPTGDIEAATRRGRAQLEAYRTWQDDGAVAIDLRRLLRDQPGVGEIRGGMGVAEVTPPPLDRLIRPALEDDRLHIGILMENAEPIAAVDELSWWKQQGLVAVGLAWARPSRFAMGNNASPDERVGVTDEGRDLVQAMDELGIVHDLSHLSQRATDDLLGLTNRPVIASHSNCRTLLDGATQRHLADETIVEIGRRGGVIGLVLCRNFIRDGLIGDERPTIDEALAHVDRICQLIGRRDVVGLGSDMDGGLTADDLPAEINAPSDLARLIDGLAARGWSAEEIDGFTHLNWLTFWRRTFNASRR